MTLSEPVFSDPFQPVSNYRNTSQHIDFCISFHARASQHLAAQELSIGLTD